MRQHSSARERGSGLLLIMIVITMLLAFAAVLTLTAQLGVRVVQGSERRMRAFYLADSGAQSGIAQVRASGGTLLPVNFIEMLDQGQASVDIRQPAVNLYQIMSTGTFLDETRTVEVHVKFTSGFSLEAAVTTTFSDGTEVEGMPFHVSANARVSGKDHSTDGGLLADQTKAVYGISANPVPGLKKFTITGAGLIEGSPSATSNNGSSQKSTWNVIRNSARYAADVRIFGSKTLASAQSGEYGTAENPKLVYAQLGEENTLQMRESFTGYGTLVIDVREAEDFSALKMMDSASWHGLVLVYIRGEGEVEGGALVQMIESSRIVGGLSIFFNTDEVEIEGSGNILSLRDSAAVLYSSELTSSARGTETLVGKSAEVISYRLP